MKINKIMAVLPIVAIICLNMSSPDISVAGGEKPTINFSGTIQDTDGNTYLVENITISGLFKQIPMYKKPNKITTKPTANITRMDLSEISCITVPNKKEESFDGRAYVELEVTYKDYKRTTERFIIEAHKRVWCDQVNEAGPIEKDLAFEAIESLTIKEYKMAELVDKNKKNKLDQKEKSRETESKNA
jgi:hypothetical protein